MEDISVSKIAVLNDEFRETGFGVTMTCDVQEITDLNGLMKEVRSFNKFDENNDPWNEHDFGRIDWKDEKVFWKIAECPRPSLLRIKLPARPEGRSGGRNGQARTV